MECHSDFNSGRRGGIVRDARGIPQTFSLRRVPDMLVSDCFLNLSTLRSKSQGLIEVHPEPRFSTRP